MRGDMQQSSQEHWWRPREAAILAIGCVSPILRDLSADPAEPPLDLPALLDSIRTLDLSQSTDHYPFLIGRALWAVSRCESILPLHNFSGLSFVPHPDEMPRLGPMRHHVLPVGL